MDDMVYVLITSNDLLLRSSVVLTIPLLSRSYSLFIFSLSNLLGPLLLFFFLPFVLPPLLPLSRSLSHGHFVLFLSCLLWTHVPSLVLTSHFFQRIDFSRTRLEHMSLITDKQMWKSSTHLLE